MIPRWLLFAAMPLLLTLGFVSGIALATYREVPAPGAAPPNEPVAEAPSPTPASDEKTSPPTAETEAPAISPEWTNPSTPTYQPQDMVVQLPYMVDEGLLRNSPSPGPPGMPTGPVTAPTSPGSGYGPVVRTRVDARAALAAEFSQYRVNGQVMFTVDYQVVRDSKQNTVLAGIVKLSEYSEWVREVREQPVRLEAWLKRAAERVRPAALNEGFHLTWTIFEAVSDVPYGFATREVTRTPAGGYVVTRPLAAVVDLTNSTVAVGSVSDLSEGTAASLTAPWAAYGPVLRFDATDLYRPIGTTSNKP